MKIHLYAVCWNEETILPHFLNYYTKFCEKIVMYDNESTDASPTIIKSYPNCELRSWNNNNQFDDLKHLELKATYRESRDKADWVIVSDTDEFIYHPNLLNKLEQYKSRGINLPKTKGYEMFPDYMPNLTESIVEAHQLGTRCPHLDKQIIFNPELDLEFSAGCHFVTKPYNVKESPTTDLRMLHYKKLTIDYFTARHEILNKRLSEHNVRMQWGTHYSKSKESMIQEYNDMFRMREKVV